VRAHTPSVSRRRFTPNELRWLSAGLFVLVHYVLIGENLSAPNQPLGDVTYTYPRWIADAMMTGDWPGLTTDGVYPFLALIPMTIGAYGLSLWFSLCVLINAVAWWSVSRISPVAGIAWLGFLALLGPIALGRIDVVTVALALIAVATIERNPRAAGVVIAVATWIKVWPVILGIAALLSKRGRTVAWWAIGSALAIAAVGLSIGGPAHVFSFLSSQQGRGIQIEAVAATPWLWDAWLGGESRIVFSPEIYTFEIVGPGTEIVSASLTVISAIVVGLVALAIVRRSLRGGVEHGGRAFAAAVTLLVSTIVAINKVGSPQFVSWYGVAAVCLVVWYQRVWSPILLGMIGAIAAMTHVFYPYFYADFVKLDFAPLVLTTARNVLEVLVFVVAIVATIWALRVEKSAQQGAGRLPVDEEGVVAERR